MRIGNISNVLADLWSNTDTRKRAVYLRGPSGIGKSDTVRQAVNKLDIEMRDVRLSQMDPVDLRGVPSVDGDTTVWNTPAFFPTDPESKGILFLDEISSAVPSVAAAAYQLVLDRQLGEYCVPDGWMIVAAGNRQADRGVTYTMPAPLMNRFTVLDVETTLDDWRDYAFENNVRPEVAAFLSDRADYLHKFEGKGEQFPSPRSWMAASDILTMDFPDNVRIELLAGVVGKEAATDFDTFLRVWATMPRLESIFTEPDSVEVPTDMSVRYCVTMGLAARMDKRNFKNAWQFLQRMPKELGVLAVKLAYQRDATLAQSSAFADWSLQNVDAFKRG